MNKYTLEERLEIGRQIYSHQLTVSEAAIKYGLNHYTARDYMRFYRDKNNLPAMNSLYAKSQAPAPTEAKPKKFVKYDDLENLSKEQLIDEVIKARVEAERAKKGYSVKGDGQEKEFINLNNTNLK